VAVPTHGPGCKTLLWATDCPDCAERVFFFACNCGSKVFFDRPGGSWPKHEDRCIPYLLRGMRRAGYSYENIRSKLREMAARTAQTVPAHVLQTLREEEYEETGREIVVVVFPQDQEHVLEGRILSSALQVNFFRRFGYEDSTFGRAFLGPLLSEPYVELRVRADADPISGICIELECFAKRATWEQLRLHDGCSVAVVVVPKRLRSDRSIWVARRIERLGGSDA
jgi:hypothetical protein